MKKSDIFLLKAIPYVIGTILFGILSFFEFRFHGMEWMISVKILLFACPVFLSIFLLIETFKKNGFFSDLIGNGIVTLRFISLIVCIFFFALMVLSDIKNFFGYSWVIAILNYIGFFLISFFVGSNLDDSVKKYIKKYYR